MNKYLSMAVITALATSAFTAGQVGAQSADLNEIGSDPERAVIIDIMILEDGTAAFIESYVTDVPPGSSIGNPEQILLESLDETSAVLGSEYSWDPRWVFLTSSEPDDTGKIGEELEVLSEAQGSFSVLFESDLHSVRITDVEAVTELITVDVRTTVEQYCYDQLFPVPVSNANPECDIIEFTDTDADTVFDIADNCPTEPNPGQEDVLSRGIGDACARPGDFNGDGNVDWLDIGQYLSWFNTPAVGDGYDRSPFDLTGDGTINVLDGRKGVLLCDLPRCAIVN